MYMFFFWDRHKFNFFYKNNSVLIQHYYMNHSIALKVENVSKNFELANGKILHALDDISFDVKQGEIFGLLGPNGAGKSTLINILAGIVIKTKGLVNVWGFDLDINPRQVRASLGIVPQEVIVDPFFSPRKLLEIQAGLYGIAKKDRITDKIILYVILFA